jgi:exodeoxyribonuclease VIII
MINEKEVIEKLRIDEHYYGDFGKKFLSNSDISTLLSNPLGLGKTREQVPAFLVGGYFHTAILEPDKLKKYKIVEASTRNTKKYKELTGGEMCLLQSEVDQLEVMIDKVLNNDVCKGLIRPIDGEYELPGITEIDGIAWKGKADIINRDDGLIVDLKTTARLDDFRWSASKYNYDSQAYIYQQIFGYDMVFVAIDKTTHQIGIFDCSPQFIQRGKDKVDKAIEAYKLFHDNPDFEPRNYFINQTL